MADRLTFTADQQRAIDARGHNILVAAAAGSGRTRVLVERVSRRHSMRRSMPLPGMPASARKLTALSVSAFC